MTAWYLRSTGERDTHSGHLRRGRALPRAASSSHHCGRGVSVVRLCLVSLILIRPARSAIGVPGYIPPALTALVEPFAPVPLPCGRAGGLNTGTDFTAICFIQERHIE